MRSHTSHDIILANNIPNPYGYRYSYSLSRDDTYIVSRYGITHYRTNNKVDRKVEVFAS